MDGSGQVRFDGWTLHARTGELQRGDVRVRLQSQPQQVLEALLERPGELVTREELIARLWPRGVVEFDASLNSAVRRLRTALGDDADAPLYIETIPRRGYRFIGTLSPPDDPPQPPEAGPAVPVEPAPQAPADPGGRRRAGTVVAALLLALGAALWFGQASRVEPPVPDERLQTPATPSPGPATEAHATSTTRSIAVLPFVDMSERRDQQYFADGLTEDVLHLLARTPGLRVIARTSSFAVRDERNDIGAVARRLGVTHVLEGSVRRSGDRMRITAQLIEAATDSHLWSQSYDRELGDVLSVQAEIASAVAGALQLVLEARPGAAANAQAYDRFLRAQYFFQRRAPGDVALARRYYEQAVEIDPGLARAWAGLAGSYWIETAEGRMPRDEGLRRTGEAARRALGLDPRLAEAHLRLSLYLRATGNSPDAERHLRAAATYEPDNPLVLSFAAGAAFGDGRVDEAIRLQQRAVTADPLNSVNRANLTSFLYQGGRLDEAKAAALESVELSPANREPAEILCLVLVLQRAYAEALELAADWPPDDRDRLQCLALAYHGLGRRREADQAVATLAESARTGSEALQVAEVYAFRADPDRAFEWLQRAREGPDGAGGSSPGGWEFVSPAASPFLEPLHTDPRWQASGEARGP